jgi:hypothetical protein
VLARGGLTLRKGAQRRRAAILASLACAGLALGPVLHAEAHLAEQRELRERALARAFELAFARDRCASQRAELSHALELALGWRSAREDGAPAPGVHRHPDPEAPGHSHGPGKTHGAGSLSHLALALHASPPPPMADAVERPRAARPTAPRLLHAIPRYLVPERSQAPPAS